MSLPHDGATSPPVPDALAAPSQPGLLGTVEDAINSVFDPVASTLSSIVFFEVSLFGAAFPLIVAWLVLAGVIFTLYFGFIQFRSWSLAIKIVLGKYTRKDEPGEVSHFQALTSAMSGTVGLGNIAGVGLAVTLGGPGATFWMIIAGLLGMVTKFVECTLGVKYRETHADGTVSGGPMHYLRRGVAERIPNRFGKVVGSVLAGGAAVTILLFGVAGGNMFQANQTYAQLRDVTGGDDGMLGSAGAALVFGLILAAVVGAVVIGGIKSIGRVTSRLVPAMAIMYCLACLVVIAVNVAEIPNAVGMIVSGAFTPEGVAGGALGALIVGFQRAAFSNEAGLGSAPIAHSAVKTKDPVTEGYVALLEPFIDTVIICTMTALAITMASTQFYATAREEAFLSGGSEVADGVTVTSDAFASVLPWFPWVLALAVVLFAVSTMITWGYYGQKAWSHLFGRSLLSERIYFTIYCAFAVIGSVLTLGAVVDFVDAVLFLLALFNIAGLYLLAPVVKREVRAFRAKLRSGEVRELEPSERA